MPNRFRFLILLVGAVLVAAAFSYPAWRTPPEGNAVSNILPELDPAFQDEFDALPRAIQTTYRLMSDSNPIMAARLLEARLRPLEPLVEDLPELGNASSVRVGEFEPLFLTEQEISEDPELELPPYNTLFSATGELTIYAYPDTRYLFRLENFSVVNGVDLWLVLSTEAKPLTSENFGRDYIEIAPLKASIGNMNYELAGININDYQSVVIYDRRYDMIFAFAQLRAGA